MVELHSCRSLSWSEFKELFLKKFSKRQNLKNSCRDFLSTHQTIELVHDFSMMFLDRVRFLPEYVKDKKLLMNHYVDMLKKEFRNFISAKDWNKDHPKPLQVCIKCYPPNHTTESCPNVKPPPLPRQQEPRRNTDKSGAPSTFKPSGAPSLARVQRPQRPLYHVYQMTAEEAKEAHDVMTDTFFVKLLPARLLFDSGADRSFVSELAKKHLAHGCQAYLAQIVDSHKSTPDLNIIPVVRMFTDVFLEELPSIPPDIQVKFCTDRILGSTPVAKNPYRLAPSEMQELMK
ncbi:hypothetical protein Tco_0032970 [Tanacetum coccineum]